MLRALITVFWVLAKSSEGYAEIKKKLKRCIPRHGTKGKGVLDFS